MSVPVQAPAGAPAATRSDRVEARLRERFPDVPFRRQEGPAVRDVTLFVPSPTRLPTSLDSPTPLLLLRSYRN